MNLTLLLDLDDTLLVNDIDSFLPNYLGAFAKHVAAHLDPDVFVKALLSGTRQMVQNRRPDCTLKDIFDLSFFSLVKVDAVEFQAVADQFYAEVFPSLRGLTHPRPQAVQLVEQALERGYRLAIATNPLFPMTAIRQRLEWAGLSPARYAFELVSSYETFHFAKPDPAYMAEVLARLGWPADPVLMVGDDLERDIAAARQAGVPAFWVPKDGAHLAEGPDAPNMQGDLEQVLPWLDSLPEDSLMPAYDQPSAMLATLRATPAALDSLCRGLPDDLWSMQPKLNEWCLTEILCHLRDVDGEVNLPRLRKVLQESNPFLPGQDTDPWAQERQYIVQDGRRALGQFIVSRARLIESLEAMAPEDWQRTARHAIFGPTRLIELVNFIAGHDRLHLHQVHQVLQTVSP